jgi:gentisate 1,2-dioxygenase
MRNTAFDERYQGLERNHLTPLWRAESAIMLPVPQPKAPAWPWKWSELRRLASTCGELGTLDRGGDGRTIGLSNPGLDGLPYATPTLWAAVQRLNGRETVPSHRYSAQAVRFIIAGQGVYSTGEGDRIDLELGGGEYAAHTP